jgi:2-dehydro-3-deoxygluconokinase
MTEIQIKPESKCRWDAVSLGEVMLRFDPGDSRVHTARQFTVWEGGGEYNVARGLRRTFGLRTALVTAIVDNPIGRLLEDLILQGGVDMRYVKWVPCDGVGRKARNGLNFVERGYGVRAAQGTSDRGHTAVSQLKRGDIDWQRIFQADGARWFHCGGVYAALSKTAPEVIEEAMAAARENHTLVSYDLNYRASLWQDAGGPEAARRVNQRLAPYVDVMVGNEMQFADLLGTDAGGGLAGAFDLPGVKKRMEKVVTAFPNIRVAGASLRNPRSASSNDWGAVAYAAGAFHEAGVREDLDIYDRVGGGDSFASGLIYGLLSGKSVSEAVAYGAAHGALAMTTPGDTAMTTLDEVEQVIRGGGTWAQR